MARYFIPLMIYDVECAHCGQIHIAHTWSDIEAIRDGRHCEQVRT